MTRAAPLAVVALVGGLVGACGPGRATPTAPAPAPARSVATPAPATPAETACERATRQRARASGLLAEGKLDRTVRVLREATALCADAEHETWAPLVSALAEVGRYAEARALAQRIEASAAASDASREAAKAARALCAERDRTYPESDEAKAEMERFYGDKGSVSWGNQIRSYVFQPYRMVKDLRTGVETSNVQAVMDGDLDAFVNGWLRAGGPMTRMQGVKDDEE